MTTPRLPFLYPHLFKRVASQDCSFGFHPLRSKHAQLRKAGISTTKCLKQETYAQRYGTATEPKLPPPGSSMPMKPQEEKSLADAIEKEVKDPPKGEEQKKTGAPKPSQEPSKTPPEDSKDQPDKSRDSAIDATLRDPTIRAHELDASESHPKEKAEAASALQNSENARKAKPLETVLQMGAPTVEKPDEHRAPLQAPPYVHHFDTFTLVKDLERGGFTEHQSVSLMKAVRGFLAMNLDIAKEGLVSKSDVENVGASLPHHLPEPALTCYTNPLLTGNLSLPRRLLRTPHGNPQHPPLLPHKNPHPTLPPPTHLRHPLPTHLSRNPRPQRRATWHAQRPAHGNPYADPAAGE